MDFSSLFSFIPEQYHPLVAVIILAIFYGFPKFQELRGSKRYFDAKMKVLEYKKLLYEVESIRKDADLGELSDAGLQELESEAVRLKPADDALPVKIRFVFGVVGALVLFTLYSVFYFSITPADEFVYYIVGVMLFAVISGGTTVLYRANKRYKSALFGGVAGMLMSMVVGMFVS